MWDYVKRLIVILAMHLAHWPATSAFLGLIIVYDQKNLSEVFMCHKYEGFFHSENSQKNRRLHKTTHFTEQHQLALTRIEREVGGTGAQLSKRTVCESSAWSP